MYRGAEIVSHEVVVEVELELEEQRHEVLKLEHGHRSCTASCMPDKHLNDE